MNWNGLKIKNNSFEKVVNILFFAFKFVAFFGTLKLTNILITKSNGNLY